MNGMIRCFILITVTLIIPRAFAGQDLNRCQQASQQAVNQCQQTAQAAESANAAQAAAAGKSATTNINTNANTSKQVNQDSANRLNNAKDQCEKEKQKCEKECDEAKRSADRKVQQGMSQQPQCSKSPCPEAKADQPQIEPTKENSCIAPIAAMMGKLGDGAGDAQNAANGDGKTGGQSGGMPPIPPPPKDDKKDEQPKQPQLTPEQYACATDPNAATSAKCTTDMVKKCTPGVTSGGGDQTCNQFTAHYCNAASGNSTPFPKAVDLNSGNSRPGSGVGTPYCNNVVAENFCQDPARSQCATCQNYRNQNSDACKANPSSCTVTTASCPVAEPPIAPPSGTTPTGGKDIMGGGTRGGGGDKMSSTAAAAQAAKESAKAGESGLKLDMAVNDGGGGGGGGGGGSGNDSWGSSAIDSFAAKYRKGASGVNLKTASAEGFRGMASVSADGLGGTTGPSLFGITTIQFQKMCNRNQLHHCGSGSGGSPGFRN